VPATRGDPDREAKASHSKLAEVAHKRSGYLDLAAEGIMGRDELMEKPLLWRRCARRLRGLEALRSRRERLEGVGAGQGRPAGVLRADDA